MVSYIKAVKHGDIGTPERHSRKELDTIVVEGQPKTIVKNVSPLHTYYKRGQIDSVQYSAGQKLYESYIKGWVGIKDRGFKERVDGGVVMPDMGSKQVQAIQDFKRGMKAAGEYKSIIEEVCVKEVPISNIVTHWYKRKKLKQELREGLDEIAKIFGFM